MSQVKAKGLDHVAIAVKDLEKAIAFYEQAFGLKLAEIEEVKEQKVRTAIFGHGLGRIELICPTEPDTGVAKFLEKRGEGLHHICIEVDDIEASLAELKAQGAPLIDQVPKIGAGGAKIAFIHPRGAHGVLTELRQGPPQTLEIEGGPARTALVLFPWTPLDAGGRTRRLMAPSRSWLAVLALIGASSSFAQTDADAGSAPVTDVETLRRELDATKKDLKEMREEVRAQLATQSAATGWSEDFVEEKRKLEVFVPDGYFRVRPELLYRMDLGRPPDPSGYTTFPIPPTTVPAPGVAKERTLAGVNMRFRFEPTFNISEEVRIRMQIDALDNVLMGATPDYAFSRDPNHAYDRDNFSVFSNSVSAPRSGINALGDSIAVKRIWGEVSTPVGILRFGRMGSHWGLGMTHNDGNCLDCDFGDTVDRVMFVAEPLAGYYVTPMVDINAEGPSSYRTSSGQVFDASNSDDAHSAVIALARRDTESQARARLEAGQTVFNYGVHLTYRWQRNDAADFLGQPFTSESATNATAGYVARNAQLWMPDVWAKFERGGLRIELEASALIGNITNTAQTGVDALTPGKNQGIGIMQFGGVLQGEYKLLDNALSIQVELGFASGDDAPGFGNYPRRKVAGADNITQPGDIDGQQYACQNTGGCTDSVIKNFRFNRDYRIDMILFREILGGITDAFYAKPTVKYRIADGFTAWGSVIYSRAIYFQSTPSYHVLTDGTKAGDANLGFEINLGARYETEDGFFGELRWGILFPLDGFKDPRPTTPTGLDSAQALRGTVGIKF